MAEQSESVLVVPKRDILDGEGCVWEYLLAEKGGNDLPPEKKGGRIIQAYSNGTLDVLFDALDYTATGIFFDELKPIDALDAFRQAHCSI